jgi:hypothetical protein
MGDIEIYMYKQVFNINKSEIFVSSLTETTNGDKIELMFHSRGAANINGSDLKFLYSKIRNKTDHTPVKVGMNNVKTIDLFIPDSDFEILKNAS